MDAYQAIVGKRDTRRFLDEPVPDESLDRILQAGRMAGSAKNAQLNRIVVVTEEAGRRRLAGCGDFTGWIHEAPVVAVLVVPVDGGRLFDVGRTAQNMMVAAHALGLGSCPVTFQHQDRVREAVGLPEDLEGPMGVVLGVPGPPDERRLPAPRIPLAELVHRERWRG